MTRFSPRTLAPAFAALVLGAVPACAQDTDETAASAPASATAGVDPRTDPDNWRAAPAENLIVMGTTKGRVLIETFPQFAPKHAARIAELAASGFYDGVIFHRVADLTGDGGFVVQGGDPDGLGTGGSGQYIDAEFTIKRGADVPVLEFREERSRQGAFYRGAPVVTQPEALRALTADGLVQSYIAHCPGTTSMARAGSDNPVTGVLAENSADSQFFLVRGETRFLDTQYTAWGRIVGGLDVVYDINVGVVMETPRFQPDAMTTVRMAAQLPAETRPTVYVMREDGPAFAALLAQMTAENGGRAPGLCDVYTPTIVVEGDGSIVAQAGPPA